MSSETTKQVNVSEGAPVERDQKAQPKMETNKDAGSEELNPDGTPLSDKQRRKRAEKAEKERIKAEKAARLRRSRLRVRLPMLTLQQKTMVYFR